MKTYVLAFGSLSELATFVKTIQPKGYTINTLQLTLTAVLTPFEFALAIEQYKAAEVQKILI